VSFGNGSNAADLYAVAPNPSASGINLSLNCAKYKINVGAQSWAGIYSDNVGSITFTPDNCIVKIQVYKPFISNYMLKMENGATTFEKIVPNTLINQWEEITFDLTDKIGQTITRMTLIPDNIATRNAERICYWDNISFNSKEPNSIQNLNNYNIRLFPNPFNDHLKITAEQEISTITVRNLIGQMVMNRTANSREINLDTQEMSTGNYLVTIKLTNGEIFTQKLVK